MEKINTIEKDSGIIKELTKKTFFSLVVEMHKERYVAGLFDDQDELIKYTLEDKKVFDLADCIQKTLKENGRLIIQKCDFYV